MAQTFRVKRSDDVTVRAYSGRECVGSRNDSYGTIGECIASAKRMAGHRTLTEVEIVNRTSEQCASYRPNGKKI